MINILDLQSETLKLQIMMHLNRRILKIKTLKTKKCKATRQVNRL